MATACISFASASGAEDICLLPNKSDSLTEGLRAVSVTKVSQLTGEASPNRTLTRFNVWGTDLGSMTEMDGLVYMFCGDTFSNAQYGDWRSNVLFIIEDDDPSDGLTISDAVTDKWGRAKELLLSRKIDNSQITVIPTNIFAVNGTLYCMYMSVKHWAATGGVWECEYAGLAKSEDKGQTWQKLKSVTWPGESSFIQTANCQIGEMMYFLGIPSGRFGGAALMRVPLEGIENLEAYSYFTGLYDDGTPRWATGSEHALTAVTVIDAPVGELSLLYNEYLGNFIVTYLNEKKHGVVIREGITPWGPWGDETVLASASRYPALYGGFMCDKYTEEKGRIFYFAMSQYFPVYNIMWMRAELPR